MSSWTKKLIAVCVMLVAALVSTALVAGRPSTVSAQSATSGLFAIAEADTYDIDAEYAVGVVDIRLGEIVEVDGEGVTIDGNTVRITASGVYTISGTLTDGCIEVDAQGKVYLEFDGVDITSSSGPALSVIDAKKVAITLVDGTENRLSDTYNQDTDTATILTNDTLIINGDGSLVVEGNNNEAVSSDDDVIINSGTIRLVAVDDGLNAHDAITINGGEVTVVAGGDGLDSNGTVTVNAGTLWAFGGTAEGEGGIDAVSIFVINGGTVVAGGNTIAAVSAGCSQCTLYVTSAYVSSAGDTISLMREDEEILAFTPECPYQNVLISASGLVEGASYEVIFGQGSAITTMAVR